eukprot:11222140-Ditylum_brightwellii.AAC.1
MHARWRRLDRRPDPALAEDLYKYCAWAKEGRQDNPATVLGSAPQYRGLRLRRRLHHGYSAGLGQSG